MIPVAEPWITEDAVKRVTDTVERGWLSPAGEHVEEFESAFAEFVGTEYAFTTSSGTSALHLSLVARGIGPGDEVIVPDLTWIACANVVEYVGAEPVFVDVTRDTFTLNPEATVKAITDDTAAIMPVHLYGYPCDMDPLRELCAVKDLFLIEDCAEAHGATYRDQSVGSIGDVGCFSFYGNKILTTGQGGMITTDDDELGERISLYRRDGMSTERKYYHEAIGYNYRMTNMQAAVGVAQVERADEIIEEKRRVARAYRDRLPESCRFQTEPEWGSPVYWMNTPVFETAAIRESVVDSLEEAEVEIRPFFYPLHDQPPYRDGRPNSESVAMDLYERGLNLPSSPLLEDEEIHTVCRAVRDAL